MVAEQGSVTPVSVEVNGRGEAIAFAFDWPGACEWGASLDKALARLETDVAWTRGWLVSHGLGAGLRELRPLVVVERVAATGRPLECDSEGFYDKSSQMVRRRYMARSSFVSLND